MSCRPRRIFAKLRAMRPVEDNADSSPSEQSTETSSAPDSRSAPLSLSRLREAFAAMLGGAQPNKNELQANGSSRSTEANSKPQPARKCEINPRSVIESILFVGRPDNGPISARELAAAMRGVSPGEVEAAIHELNKLYAADRSPYHIEQAPVGYRLVLRPEFERVRDKFYGRIKEARLAPSVLEVLSVLAYNQPATAEQLNEIRGESCGAALATLVRRKLAHLDRPADKSGPPTYSTTDRFLKLFNLENLTALPRSEELEKV
jgi:segregation and condensation protein B